MLRRDGPGALLPGPVLATVGTARGADGIHHLRAVNVVGDALRQNAPAPAGDSVLRLPLLGLRLQPAFLAQIDEAPIRPGRHPKRRLEPTIRMTSRG